MPADEPRRIGVSRLRVETWLALALTGVTLVYLLALLTGLIPPERKIDGATLLLLLFVTCLILVIARHAVVNAVVERLQKVTVKAGTLEVELADIKDRQERILDDLSLLYQMIATQQERQHILNLRHRAVAASYRGNYNVRNELMRLERLGLVEEVRPGAIEDIPLDDRSFDLAETVRLSEFGQRFVAEVEARERAFRHRLEAHDKPKAAT